MPRRWRSEIEAAFHLGALPQALPIAPLGLEATRIKNFLANVNRNTVVADTDFDSSPKRFSTENIYRLAFSK
jgi:hypothetical protein